MRGWQRRTRFESFAFISVVFHGMMPLNWLGEEERIVNGSYSRLPSVLHRRGFTWEESSNGENGWWIDENENGENESELMIENVSYWVVSLGNCEGFESFDWVGISPGWVGQCGCHMSFIEDQIDLIETEYAKIDENRSRHQHKSVQCP